MPDRTTQKTLDQFEALLDLIEQDGVTAPGELPPPEYVRALRESNGDRRPLKDVSKAHREGRGPPNHAGAPDDAGPPENRGGGQ